MEIKEYSPGTFCWVELATSDGESAKKILNPPADIPEIGRFSAIQNP